MRTVTELTKPLAQSGVSGHGDLHISISSPHSMFLAPMTMIDVSDIISNLNNTSATVINEIPTHIIKKTVRVICLALQDISNSFIEVSLFPSAFKISKIPIHNVNCNLTKLMCLPNYRLNSLEGRPMLECYS